MYIFAKETTANQTDEKRVCFISQTSWTIGGSHFHADGKCMYMHLSCHTLTSIILTPHPSLPPPAPPEQLGVWSTFCECTESLAFSELPFCVHSPDLVTLALMSRLLYGYVIMEYLNIYRFMHVYLLDSFLLFIL